MIEEIQRDPFSGIGDLNQSRVSYRDTGRAESTLNIDWCAQQTVQLSFRSGVTVAAATVWPSRRRRSAPTSSTELHRPDREVGGRRAVLATAADARPGDLVERHQADCVDRPEHRVFRW